MTYSSLLHSDVIFFFFNDTATTEIYTLSLHDALPTSRGRRDARDQQPPGDDPRLLRGAGAPDRGPGAAGPPRLRRVPEDHRHRGPALPSHRREPVGLLAPQEIGRAHV